MKTTEPTTPSNKATPRTDRLWLSIYPHDQERDERLEAVLMFARDLEREIAGRLDVVSTATEIMKLDHGCSPHPPFRSIKLEQITSILNAAIARATGQGGQP